MLATCIPSSTLGVKEQENDPKEAARNYPQTYFILDIFAMLPMPQVGSSETFFAVYVQFALMLIRNAMCPSISA